MRIDLEKIPSTVTGDQLIFDAMVDTFEEYVIGPELHAKNDFYRLNDQAYLPKTLGFAK